MQIENYHFCMINYDNVIDNAYFYLLLLLKITTFWKKPCPLQAVKDNPPTTQPDLQEGNHN